jgi:sulfatase maturation enzyme AslB (radical SAM superfamily)
MTLEEIMIVHNKFFEQRHIFSMLGYNYIDSHLNITGGEPMLYSKLEELIKLLPKHYDTTKFLTNGISYSKKIVKSLIHNSNKLIYQISLDGMKESHDYIRGDGMFNITTTNIKKIRDDFPDLHIQISFNVNSKNKDDLPTLVPYIKSLGVNCIMMDRYVPHNECELNILSYKEYKDYDNLINTMYKKYNDTTFNVLRHRSLQNDMSFHCEACIENQICCSNGNRFACSRYQIKTGNWFTDDATTLVTNGIQQANLLLKTPKECEDCIHSSICNGGMRCLTYHTTKSITKKDIHCFKYCKKV